MKEQEKVERAGHRVFDLLAKTSHTAKAIVEKDWRDAPLGSFEQWPTELKNALALILDTKFPHFIAWGPEMTLLYNDAYAAVIDDDESALGMPFADYWQDAWATVGPIARAAMAGTASYFEDLSLKMSRPGRWSQTWWTFSYSPIRVQDGSVGGLFCTATETTKHKLLERELEEGQRSLRRFTDLVPNFLWESDELGRMHYMNRQMLTYLGRGSPDELEDWSDFVHPDDIGVVVAAYAEAQDEQGQFECQHRIRAADGSYHWFLARAHPIYDDEGGVSGWFGCATDINHWRIAVEQLRKSEELVRQFAENAARIFWIADLKSGNVEYLNAAGRRFWDGDEHRPVKGWEDWFRTVHPDHHNMVANALDRLRAGETVTGVYRVVDGRLNYCDARVTLFPITEADGRIVKFGGIAEVIEHRQRRLVHLVDPDRDAHRQLSALLWSHGFEVRGFTDVHAFAKVAPALLPGCVVVRATTQMSWVTRVVAAARQQSGRLPVLVLTDQHRDADHVRELMKNGASDVLPHDADWETLSPAIVDATRSLNGPESLAAVKPAGEGHQRLASLSLREREILERLTGGATNKVVAIDLGISPRTVEAHRARIFEKLGVSSLAEAVAITVAILPGT